MATWITHLRIAELFHKRVEVRSFPYYLIGNLAPDSGKLNDDRLTYTPSSDSSHYRDRTCNKWYSKDLVFYSEYCSKVLSQNEDYYSFCLGYYHHLVVDVLWGYFIHHPTKHKYSNQFKDSQFIWEVKKDWYGIDFEYLRRNRTWAVWDTFRASYYGIHALDFYPQENIINKQKEIKEFYESEQGFVSPNIYLKYEDIDSFVDICANFLIEIAGFIDNGNTASVSSVLEILEKKHTILQESFIFIREASKN
jgi:hypothetical protein